MRLYQRKYRGTDGTKRKGRVWCARFYVRGKLHDKSLGTRDRRAAELIAADLVRRSELRLAGVTDPFEEHRIRPLSGHFADFETTLRGRNVTDAHRSHRLACLRAYADVSGAKVVGDLDLAPGSAWLSGLRTSGLSARSVNQRYQALRQFGRWLARSRRVAFDPFEGLSPLNEAADRRYVRRALSEEELTRLYDAAERRPIEMAREQRVLAGVSVEEEPRLRALGRARALVYRIAAGTGLRRGELGRLRWQDVDLDRRVVAVPAASAKSRCDQEVPLRVDLADALQAHRPVHAQSSDTVFPAASFPNHRTFRLDLVEAGIARAERVETTPPGTPEAKRKYRRVVHVEDDAGRVVDFHSLRVSFVSGLAAKGVHPRVAQALARHSSVELTMRAYTDVHLLDLRGAVERLAPAAPPSAPAGAESPRQLPETRVKGP